MLALGMTAPVESDAAPMIVPLATWAGASPAAIVMISAALRIRDKLYKINLLYSRLWLSMLSEVYAPAGFSFSPATQSIKGVAMNVVTRAIETIIENSGEDRMPLSRPTFRT